MTAEGIEVASWFCLGLADAKSKTSQFSPFGLHPIRSCRPSRAKCFELQAHLGLAPQAFISHASGVQNPVPYSRFVWRFLPVFQTCFVVVRVGSGWLAGLERPRDLNRSGAGQASESERLLDLSPGRAARNSPGCQPRVS